MRLSSALAAAAIVMGGAAGLFSASSSFAASTKAPPGLSGAVQYTETIPGAGGNKPVRDIKGDKPTPHGTPAQTLGSKHAAKLEALGPDGQAAAELAAAGAVGKKGKQHHHAGGAGSKGGGPKTPHRAPGNHGAHTGAASEASGSSSTGQIVDQVLGSSGSGMGFLQPLLIVVAAVGALTFVFRRRHSPSNRG